MRDVRDFLRVRGRVRLREWDERGCLLREVWADNLVTTVGISFLLSLIGGGGGVGAGYLAVGTGAAPPSTTDTVLSAELARASLTSLTVTGNTATLSTYFTTAQAVGSWTECGLFGGVNAGAGAGTGVLLTHAALSYVKSSSYAVTADYVLTLS